MFANMLIFTLLQIVEEATLSFGFFVCLAQSGAAVDANQPYAESKARHEVEIQGLKEANTLAAPLHNLYSGGEKSRIFQYKSNIFEQFRSKYIKSKKSISLYKIRYFYPLWGPWYAQTSPRYQSL